MTVKVAAAPLSVTVFVVPVPLVATLLTVTLNPARSRMPLDVLLPSVSAVPEGRAFAEPKASEPAWTLVAPP